MRFERHPSQVVFDPSCMSFVVTWAKCGISDEARLEKRKDPIAWIPSVSAVASLYDRGCIPQRLVVRAAMAVGRAWDAGDREGLDTEGARKAAELVRDLGSMCVDASSPSVERDVGQAMRHLLDEMARVRFADLPESEFSDRVLSSLSRAAAECVRVPGFASWPRQSMRRRFLFCLNRKERTAVAYALASLLFDSGSCPILSLSDRRALRMEAANASELCRSGFTRESMDAFFAYAMNAMKSAKDEGSPSLLGKVTQQQLVDSLGSSS